MFNKDFVWGVATASYQIEGAAYEADKGKSVWDVGSATPGRVFGGHTGDVACDHYHRFKEDVAIMRSLGVKNYRLSLCWPRIIPNGVGQVSEDGKRFYLELFQTLKEAGITPWVTLFHWDYPYELFLKGGWLNEESPAWFENYAKTVVELFGDYVENYVLVNEPECFINSGHFQGAHAPFLKLPESDVVIAVHNVLTACARAEKIMRKTAGKTVKIGTAHAIWPAIPVTEDDYETAKAETFRYRGEFSTSAFWTDGLVFGRYPDDYRALLKTLNAELDESVLGCKLDFLGFNTYTGNPVKTGVDGKAEYVEPLPGTRHTAMGWTVYPKSIYYSAKYLYDRYKLPVICTENGVALTEWRTDDGKIHDACRIDYINEYLKALSCAAEEVPVLGYFYWSFMDNFEWAEGYKPRFGLVYVDYNDCSRTLKDSAYWYKQVILTNGNSLTVSR